MYLQARINAVKIWIIKNPFTFFLGVITFLFFYDYVFNLDVSFFPSYELPSVLILTALGTIGAVAIALFLPNYQEKIKRLELRQSLVSAIIQEIYLNFYSIYHGGMMEIHIEKDQYKAVQNNIYIFPPYWIDTQTERIKQIYNLFDLYEYYWRRQNPDYNYFMYEIKFKVKVEILIFMGILESEDYGIRDYLTQILTELRLTNPSFIYDLIDPLIDRDRFRYTNPLEYILKNTSKGDFNARIEYNIDNGKRMDDLIVEYFERYIDEKYNFNNIDIRKNLKSKIY